MNLAELKRNMEFVENTHNLDDIKIFIIDYKNIGEYYEEADAFLELVEDELSLVVK